MKSKTSLLQEEGSISAGPAPNATDKVKVLIEVLAVFGAALGIMWTTNMIPAFESWQRDVFGQIILSAFLSSIFIPLVVIWWIRRKETRAITLNMANTKEALKTGGKSFAVMMPVTFLSFPVVQGMGFSFYEWKGGLIIAGWHLLAIPILCLIFRKSDSIKESGFSTKDISYILVISVISIVLIYGLRFLSSVASDVVISLVFIGFREEFMYRGYIQGRLNQAFGKPFTMLGFSFGWGLVLASFLFGMAHVLSPANPLHLAWGLWTFVAGICFGIIREKGGSFLASALVHGVIMVFPVFFG